MTDAPPAWAVFSGTSRRSSNTLSALAAKRLDSAAPVPPAPPDLDAIAAAALSNAAIRAVSVSLHCPWRANKPCLMR